MQYRYEYDRLGQLIREDNRPLNKTIVYIYDYAGNLTQAKTCIFTTAESPSGFYLVENYTYDGNRLTSDVGNYDALGNPWYYHGADLTWDGRRLTEFANYDGNSI